MGRLHQAESGNIAPLAVVISLVLFAVLAFSIDQGIACAAKVRQENALDTARDACMGTSFALVVKNEEDPGRAIATRFVETLHNQGFSGSISVWFYEVSASKLPLTRRVWGIAVQLEEQTPTVFARGYGVPSISVASKRILIAEPFSNWQVWRPAQMGKGNGLYRRDSANSSLHLTYTPIASLEGFPSELHREIQAALTDISKP